MHPSPLSKATPLEADSRSAGQETEAVHAMFREQNQRYISKHTTRHHIPQGCNLNLDSNVDFYLTVTTLYRFVTYF
jgi:hypothetical protein